MRGESSPVPDASATRAGTSNEPLVSPENDVWTRRFSARCFDCRQGTRRSTSLSALRRRGLGMSGFAA